MAETRKLTYYARIGGTQTAPIFCDVAGHEHDLVENAAACLPANSIGSMGEVYEAADGVFTDAFWEYEKRRDNKKYSSKGNGSPLKGKSRSDF